MKCLSREKRSRVSNSWTKAYSNGDNCRYLICSFSAFSGMLSTKVFKRRSTAEYRPSLFLPCIFCLLRSLWSWKKKKRKMVMQRAIHNVDRGDVGTARVVLQALPSSKVVQEGIWFRALLKEKNNGCALSYSIIPTHFCFSIRGIFSGLFLHTTHRLYC